MARKKVFTRRLSIWLTEEEYGSLLMLADVAGILPSVYARYALGRYADSMLVKAGLLVKEELAKEKE